MNGKPIDIIVVGQGAAGLAAALSAAEEARARDLPVAVSLIDKASADEAGGNTRWTPAYMRMAAPDRVEPSFVHDMLEATRFQGDESYFARLAHDVPATVAWIAAHGVEFHQPTYYLAKGPPRIQPVGGGAPIFRQLTRVAQEAGVLFRHACAAEGLVAAYNAACTGDPARFDPTRCEGLSAGGPLVPPKSNWARAISEPPFLAWPLVGGVAYTFGGLATDDRARVLRGGAPIPGLYAAGEITGHFYATAPNAVSVLRAFVFGRIAGREAVASALRR